MSVDQPRPRRPRRWLRRTLTAILAVALTLLILTGGYLGYAAIRHAQPVTLPATGGAYRVGRIVTEWTDQSRTDTLSPTPGKPRELAVWLWYPAPKDASGPRAAYAPGLWAALHFPGIAALGETDFDAVRGQSRQSVPVAAGRFPVVVLEPGLGLAAPQYTAIAENLASHGYLVAGVTPTYSANTTVLGGRVVAASPAGNPADLNGEDLHAPTAERAAVRLVRVWAADARFAANQVAALDRAGPLAGHVDTTGTAYVGHSLGGAAALQACQDDPQCTAAADLDGAQFGPVVRAGLRRPLLIMASDSCVAGTCRPTTAGERSDQATARSLLSATTGPVRTYQVEGMRHFDFADYDALFVAWPLRQLLALGTLPRARGVTIASAYLTAFLDHAVRGQPEVIPTQYPEVRAQFRAN
jgi:dienelactone hydrolase